MESDNRPDRPLSRIAGEGLCRLGIVVGLAAEARIARRLNHPVAIGGAGSAGAETAARRLVANGATALLSFGLCGGLDPALAAGALLIPQEVVENGTRHAASPVVAVRFGGLTPHRLLGGTRVAVTAADKRRLHEATGAAAVDLESGAVARVAAEAGLPFAALRAICDPAAQDLPPAALVAMDENGAIGIFRLLAALAANPGQLPALLTLARQAVAARRSLLRAVASAHPSDTG